MVNLFSVDILGIVIGIVAAALVVFTVTYNIIRRKKGKGCCDGGCKSCSYCSKCSPEDKEAEQKLLDEIREKNRLQKNK